MVPGRGGATSSFLAGDVDLEPRRDAMRQLGRDFVLAHKLDWLGKLDAPLINCKALSGERLCNIAGGNRPEELIVFAGLAGEAEGNVLQQLRLLLRPIAFSGRAFGERGADFLQTLQVSRRSFQRKFARQQIISRVSFLDADHVSARAKFFDIFLQDNLHGISLVIPPGYSSVANGSSAMFRARLTATPNQRWCLEQVPVMRRGKILPRSCTKGWSISTFL